MNFQKGKKNDDLEINFIPLIDVLLVIIIFLVVSTTFARFSQLKINLPTAEAKESGRFFYEPNRDVWLDLDNPYEIQTSDFGIDFVYSNEQYAKILQGQSIVVLYFRKDPTYREID